MPCFRSSPKRLVSTTKIRCAQHFVVRSSGSIENRRPEVEQIEGNGAAITRRHVLAGSAALAAGIGLKSTAAFLRPRNDSVIIGHFQPMGVSLLNVNLVYRLTAIYQVHVAVGKELYSLKCAERAVLRPNLMPSVRSRIICKCRRSNNGLNPRNGCRSTPQPSVPLICPLRISDIGASARFALIRIVEHMPAAIFLRLPAH